MDQSRLSKIASAKLKLKEYQRKKLETSSSDCKSERQVELSTDSPGTAMNVVPDSCSTSDQLTSDPVPMFTFPADSPSSQSRTTHSFPSSLPTPVFQAGSSSQSGTTTQSFPSSLSIPVVQAGNSSQPEGIQPYPDSLVAPMSQDSTSSQSVAAQSILDSLSTPVFQSGTTSQSGTTQSFLDNLSSPVFQSGTCRLQSPQARAQPADGEDSLTSSFAMSTTDGASSSGSASRHSEWEYVNNGVSARADLQANQQDVIEIVGATSDSVTSDNNKKNDDEEDSSQNDLTLSGVSSGSSLQSPLSPPPPPTTATTTTAETSCETVASPYETLCRLNERLIRMTDDCGADETNPVLAELRSRLAASDRLKQQLQLELNAANLESEKNQLRITQQHQQVQQENERLQSKVEQLSSEVHVLQTVNQGLKSENQGLKTENQEIKFENEGLKTENQRLNAENQVLKADKHKIMSENKELTTVNQEHQLQQNNQQVLADNNQLATENQRLISENQRLQQQIRQFVTAEADNQQNRAREQSVELQQQLQLTEHNLKLALQEVATLREHVESRDQLVTSLRERWDKEGEGAGVVSAPGGGVDIARLNVELQETRASLSEAALTNKQLRHQLESFQQQRDDSESQLASLQEQLQASSDDLAEQKVLVDEQRKQIREQAERLELLESVMTDEEKQQQQQQQQDGDAVIGSPGDERSVSQMTPPSLEQALRERAELRGRLRQLLAGGAVETHVHEQLRRELVQVEEQLHSCREQLAESERQRLDTEHVCEQLRQETDTIGEYISVYRTQRAALQRQEADSNRHVEQLHAERYQLRQQLKQLQLLITGSQQHELSHADGCENEEAADIASASPVVSEVDRAETTRRIVQLVEQLDSCRSVGKESEMSVSCAHVCHHCSGRRILEV